MPVSMREKGQWALLLTVAFVYGQYYARVLPGHGPDVAVSDVVLFIGAVVSLVLLQVVGHVLLAIVDRDAARRGVERDERDALIDLRASRVGYHVLAVGVVAALSTALAVPGNFAFVHVLFGGWVLSSLAETATRLFFYRRGA